MTASLRDVTSVRSRVPRSFGGSRPSERGESAACKRCVSSMVRFHIGISEVLNASLPLRMVEIMIEKCAATVMRGPEESKREMVAIHIHVMSVSHTFNLLQEKLVRISDVISGCNRKMQ